MDWRGRRVRMDEDYSLCGMCGADPVEHEYVSIGVTMMNLCEECYQIYLRIIEENRILKEIIK